MKSCELGLSLLNLVTICFMFMSYCMLEMRMLGMYRQVMYDKEGPSYSLYSYGMELGWAECRESVMLDAAPGIQCKSACLPVPTSLG